MTDETSAKLQKLTEAIEALRLLGLPSAQQNERSALTLLGLLGLGPEDDWAVAARPLRGITELMDFMHSVYGHTYAPNTRETIRRQTMHQFVEAGIAVMNPDEPTRPVNSPKSCYQISDAAFAALVVRSHDDWPIAAQTFVETIGSLRDRWAMDREMNMIPVTSADGVEFKLTPGGQNDLVKLIVEEFCARFTPGAALLYVGDAGAKWVVDDQEGLRQLGVDVDSHGKMPDVVVHYGSENWLVLIEAVTSHGPVDAKRVGELRRLFQGASAGLVFVTAFETLQAFARYAPEICWETEVWIAENPAHLIHYDGKRFLGPYE